MWFYSKDDIALNLAKATTINIKKINNKFKVYVTYTENIQEKYLLNVFNTLNEAKIFIQDILIKLNTNKNNTNTSTDNLDPKKIEYAFIELSE